MIKTDEFGRVSVGGMIDSLFALIACSLSMQALGGQLLEVQFQKDTTKEY